MPIGKRRTRMPVAWNTALATAPAEPVIADLADALDAERIHVRIEFVDR